MSTRAKILALQAKHGTKSLTVNQMLIKANDIFDGDELVNEYARYPLYLLLAEIIIRLFEPPSQPQ